MKFDLVLLTRIFVGSLLGCVIGWEREARGSAAGDRTFGLVSLADLGRLGRVAQAK